MTLDLMHRQPLTIRGNDVDLTMHLSITALIRILHDAALDQVIQLGFSALQLAPRGLGWVLAHQQLEVFDRPRLGDQVEVLTYPSGVGRAFTYRDYYLKDNHQRLLAQSTTTWILMDIHTHKMATYPDDIKVLLDLSNALLSLPRAVQPRIRFPEMKHSKSFEPGYFEEDFNGHVSNHFFFKWLLNPLPYHFMKHHELEFFNVKLKGEVFVGDRITAQIEMENPERILHILLKENEIIATAISRWRPIPTR